MERTAKVMTNDPRHKPRWKKGDLVRFAHQPDGPDRIVTAIQLPFKWGDWMVEIEGMSGSFDQQIFIPSPKNSET
jgi:hypothetical protein